mgnify:CR=1 FL=1
MYFKNKRREISIYHCSKKIDHQNTVNLKYSVMFTLKKIKTASTGY